MDSESQHSPSDIPKLIAPILAGEKDLVIGNCYSYDRSRNIPYYRRVGHTILDTFTKMNSSPNVNSRCIYGPEFSSDLLSWRGLEFGPTILMILLSFRNVYGVYRNCVAFDGEVDQAD